MSLDEYEKAMDKAGFQAGALDQSDGGIKDQSESKFENGSKAFESGGKAIETEAMGWNDWRGQTRQKYWANDDQ